MMFKEGRRACEKINAKLPVPANETDQIELNDVFEKLNLTSSTIENGILLDITYKKETSLTL